MADGPENGLDVGREVQSRMIPGRLGCLTHLMLVPFNAQGNTEGETDYFGLFWH